MSPFLPDQHLRQMEQRRGNPALNAADNLLADVTSARTLSTEALRQGAVVAENTALGFGAALEAAPDDKARLSLLRAAGKLALRAAIFRKAAGK